MQMYTLSELAKCQIRAGQYKQAIENLEKLQAQGISPFNSTVALYFPTSYYLLGQAYEGAGNIESARFSYAKFLQLWKDADDDLVLLIDAKKRYEKLISALES